MASSALSPCTPKSYGNALKMCIRDSRGRGRRLLLRRALRRLEGAAACAGHRTGHGQRRLLAQPARRHRGHALLRGGAAPLPRTARRGIIARQTGRRLWAAHKRRPASQGAGFRKSDASCSMDSWDWLCGDSARCPRASPLCAEKSAKCGKKREGTPVPHSVPSRIAFEVNHSCGSSMRACSLTGRALFFKRFFFRSWINL